MATIWAGEWPNNSRSAAFGAALGGGLGQGGAQGVAYGIGQAIEKDKRKADLYIQTMSQTPPDQRPAPESLPQELQESLKRVFGTITPMIPDLVSGRNAETQWKTMEQLGANPTPEMIQGWEKQGIIPQGVGAQWPTVPGQPYAGKGVPYAPGQEPRTFAPIPNMDRERMANQILLLEEKLKSQELTWEERLATARYVAELKAQMQSQIEKMDMRWQLMLNKEAWTNYRDYRKETNEVKKSIATNPIADTKAAIADHIATFSGQLSRMNPEDQSAAMLDAASLWIGSLRKLKDAPDPDFERVVLKGIEDNLLTQDTKGQFAPIASKILQDLSTMGYKSYKFVDGQGRMNWELRRDPATLPKGFFDRTWEFFKNLSSPTTTGGR